MWLVMALVPALVVGDEAVRGQGLMDKLSNGMKFAKDFLGKLVFYLIVERTSLFIYLDAHL